MRVKFFLILLCFGFLILNLSFAKMLEVVPSEYAKVSWEIPGGNPPGQLSRLLVYVDGPLLYWRGVWKDPRKNDPIPDLLVPVRVVIPGVYKLHDLETDKATQSEVKPESFTPEAKVYRLFLPIRALNQTHRFTIELHAGQKVPLYIKVLFAPESGLIVRNKECKLQGIDLDYVVSENSSKDQQNHQNLVYLYCGSKFGDENVYIGVYAPFDKKWIKAGIKAETVLNERGLFFPLPIPERGEDLAQTVTELGLESDRAKVEKFILRYHPPFRPKRFSLSLGLAEGIHHYSQTKPDLAVDEISLHGQVEAALLLHPKFLQYQTDFSMMFLDHTHSPNDEKTPEFRYWSWSNRLGYVTPEGKGTANWSFLIGYQWWQLIVPSDLYGFAKGQGGPEFWMQYRYKPQWGREFWLNGGFALLGGSGFPNDFDRYSSSLRIGFELFGANTKHPVSLELQYSRQSITADSFTMGINSYLLWLKGMVF